MIITGGMNDGARNAAEVYDVLTGKRCTLPKLPDNRDRHVQVKNKRE